MGKTILAVALFGAAAFIAYNLFGSSKTSSEISIAEQWATLALNPYEEGTTDWYGWNAAHGVSLNLGKK